MKPFAVNRHGRLVLPSNFFPQIDFSRLETLEQLAAVVNYVRTHFGNDYGDSVSADDVKAARR